MSATITAAKTAPPATQQASETRSGGLRPPRVAIYLHDLSGGGIERQNLVIAEVLRSHGADVTLVLHRLRGPLRDQVPPEIRVVALDSRRTRDDVGRLADYLRREKPDILLANFDVNNLAALLAKAISLTSTRVVICQHNPLSSSFFTSERRLYRYIGLGYRVLAPFVSQAIAVSEGLAEELHRLGGLPRRRIVTINNPVIGPDFAQRSAQPVSHPWLHDPDRPVFITAGRLVPQKDHATLLRALALHRRGIPSRLLILGTGPLEAELKALVASLDLGDAVDFLGFRTDAPAWFRNADAFVLSSRSEGFGNVVVEALGCGTPVIATNCDYGPGDILANGRHGLLVPTADPVALANAMDQVGSLRRRFPADALRERANAFTYQACTNRYIEVLMTLTPNRAWAVAG